MALVHALPQPPQSLELPLVSSSQPSSAAGAAGNAQLPLPSTHVDAHTPPWHTLDATFVDAHARPHAPQLSASVSRRTSQPSATMPLQSAYPGSHEATVHAEPAQPAVPLATAQAWPHPPQLATSPRVAVSQPFCGSPSQSPNPGSQVGAHAPALHATAPCALAQGSHTLAPHPEAGSSVDTHAVPQSLVAPVHPPAPPEPVAAAPPPPVDAAEAVVDALPVPLA